jgi:two-component system, chemotaxis family, CheB/CheR fusion protein
MAKTRGGRRGSPAAAAKDADVQPPAAAEDQPVRLIVGIGASAGGLDAFKAFFMAMPADSGMAFVLVQHLDPTHVSALPEIVADYTTMPVHIATDGAVIAPDHVYVIPPDALLEVAGGLLRVTRPLPAATRRTSINIFLTSLAEDQGDAAIGIILSGFGSDGTRGIAAIKEHGGLTLSQAEYDLQSQGDMPHSAASSGFIDHVLPVQDMPAILLNYQRHRMDHDARRGPDGIRDDLRSHLTTTCAVLHGRLGRDFSQYKTGTLMRRIQRRMQVLRIDAVPSYIEQLRTSPQEAELLFRELLITVTRFFRDAEVFQALEATIIPGLLAQPRDNGPIRIWVAGCATGEEVYSLAILLKEGMAQAGRRRRIQIFATDIDDRAIEAARVGLYPDTIAADMSVERLEQNFVQENGNYRVAKDIRDMCLFSAHDLVKDPPFSKLDLISCRNLLIYFSPQLQNRVLTIFHYALRSDGCLVLGLSEGVTTQPQLFEPVDKRYRIFVRRNAAARLPALSRSHAPERGAMKRQSMLSSSEEVDRRVARAIARYAPAHLVVDQHYDILRFSGQTGKYIEHPTGIASLNLFNLLRADLRPVVRAALTEAAETGNGVRHEGVPVEAGDHVEAINLIVEPLVEPDGVTLFMIAFQETAPAVAVPRPVQTLSRKAASPAVQALTKELLATKERLRNVTEELRSCNEELQSSSEEYQSVNEELQSANEELETSKEELQSLNEELQTINAELNQRNESLVRSNSDLANLFDSTTIAILFLDSALHIRRFTPRLLEIFNVRDGDEGRPISDIVTRLTRDWLGQDVRQVLASLTPLEREVALAEGGISYLMQVRPYRDLNNVIDGVIITFVDISERKKHEQARSRLAAIVESSQDAIISHDMNGIVTSWNEGAEQLFGYSPSEAIGQSASILDGAVPEDWPRLLTRLRNDERIVHFDTIRTAKDGQPLQISVTISPVRESDGRVAGASVVARDISERKAAERKTTLLLSELDHRVKNILAVVAAVVTQTLKTTPTPAAFAAEVEGRIKAIAKAHSLLTHSGEGQVSLRAVVTLELAPYDNCDGNVAVTGPDVSLTPKAGLALAMAFHELASNAAKYGALSAATARLSVGWSVSCGTNGPTLTIVWAERDGPEVRPPERRGFGTTLIERALTDELDAEVHRDFLAAGLHCTFAIPFTEEVGYLPAARTFRKRL